MEVCDEIMLATNHGNFLFDSTLRMIIITGDDVLFCLPTNPIQVPLNKTFIQPSHEGNDTIILHSH